MKSCCGNFSKYFLELLNIILFILGYLIIMSKLDGTLSMYFIVVGSAFFVLDVVSWWAAFREHRCMLITLAVFESMLFVSIIVLLVLINKNEGYGQIESSRMDEINKILGVAAGIEIVRIGLESYMASVILAERYSV